MASAFKRKPDRKVKGSKWIIRWWDAQLGKWKQESAYSDREASMEYARKLEAQSARIATGLERADFGKPAKTIAELIEEYMGGYRAKLRDSKRDERYVSQVRNRITRIVAGVRVSSIHQLDPIAVRDFLDGLKKTNKKVISGVTRNEYVNCIKAFTDWAVRSRRVEHDPLAALERTERKDITFKHRRRALTVEQVAKLLDATERRPLHELLVIRRGKDKGKLSANVRQRILERAKRTGAERRLAYLLAVWTGLRRSELGALRWSDVVLDAEPAHIRLRAETTKAKRADRVILHQEIADELRRIKPAKLAPTATVLSSVPGMKVLVSDLRFAGIDPGCEEDGFIDLHALRKTLSTMMAVAGLNQRVRQAHMRHTDPRLTDNTYVDSDLLPVASELARLSPITSAKPELCNAKVLLNAALMQHGAPSDRQGEATLGTGDVKSMLHEGREGTSPQPLISQGIGIKRERLAPCGTERFIQAGERGRTVDIHVGNVTLYH